MRRPCFLIFVFVPLIMTMGQFAVSSITKDNFVDILPNSNSELNESAGDETKRAREALKSLCTTFYWRSNCEKLAAHSYFTEKSVNFCKQSSSHELDCLELLKNKKVNDGTLAFCENFQDSGDFARSQCLKFFLTSSGYFQKEALTACAGLNAGSNSFNKTKECLNLVRDKDLDASDLKACKTASGTTKDGIDTPFRCIERLAHRAPVKAEVLCKSPSIPQKSSAQPSAQESQR